MPSYLIKPDAERDFYVVWSTIVEAPTAWGPADYVHTCLVEDAENPEKPYSDKSPNQWERIVRADKHGSSARWPSSIAPVYGWNHVGMIYKQQGRLPRWRLPELCERLELKHDVDDLLEPLEGRAVDTPDSAPRWIGEPVSQNWIHTDPTPGTMWDWFDAAADNDTARRFRQEYFGEWSTEEQPDLRWIHDPAAPVTTPLGDLIDEKDFPLRVRKHREYLDKLEKAQTARAGRSAGLAAGWAYLIAGVGLISGVIGVLFATLGG